MVQPACCHTQAIVIACMGRAMHGQLNNLTDSVTSTSESLPLLQGLSPHLRIGVERAEQSAENTARKWGTDYKYPTYKAGPGS